MKILRFLKQVKYIKKLESFIEEYERAKNITSERIRILESQRNDLSAENMKLNQEIAILKSAPPELKLASNIDISDPIFQKIIKAGRASMVKKAHPDHGGSREEFEKVEKAFEILKSLKIQPQEKPAGYRFTGHPNDDLLRAYYAQQQGMAAARQRSGAFGYGYSWPL